ncbi:MAG: ribosome rescue protein RqcH [Haloarculaceae archaeon]
MDRKRDLTSVGIAALAVELGRYAGARVDKVYLYGEDFLRFRLRDFDRGRIELLVDVGETKHVRVADPAHVPDAPERPPDFAMMLRNRLAGAELAAVEQFEFDRILSVRFERDDDSTTVVAELFGDGNAAVLDSSGEVIDSLETVRLKSRTVAPGAPYEFPEARFDPLGVDREAFVARMEASETDLVRTLATRLNFGGLWAEELCTRAGVPKTMAIEEAGEAEFDALYRVVGELAGRLRAGEFDPRVYYEAVENEQNGIEAEDDRVRVDVTPVPLEEYADLESEAYETFNGALDDYYTGFEAETGEGGEAGAGGRERPDFEEQIERQQRIIEQQESAIEEFEAEAEETREAAAALYANYDLVDEVLATIRAARAEDRDWDEIEATIEAGAEQGIPAAEAVVSLDAAAGTGTLDVDDHRVTLEVDEGVEKNADRLYREAKAIEEKKAGAEDAIEGTRAELAAVRERRDAWEAGEAGEDGAGEAAEAGEAGGAGTEASEGRAGAAVPGGEEDEAVDWLARGSIPIRQEEDWYEQFRWFHTSDDFLVIGGRNADQNEDLVAKYLETGDRFFHTQAHGGPATILKATGPSESTREEVEIPARSREQAARFAVSYSAIWKEGKYAADVYEVGPDQVSKTPGSGEYLEKGGFAIRGDRTYHENTEVGVAVGIACEPETRVLGGPHSAIEPRVATSIRLEPGRYAQNDMAKKCYREFKERFDDDTFVRKVASPDRIQEFLPAGGSRMVD